jgi:hypothetical protein
MLRWNEGGFHAVSHVGDKPTWKSFANDREMHH